MGGGQSGGPAQDTELEATLLWEEGRRRVVVVRAFLGVNQGGMPPTRAFPADQGLS